MAIGKLSALQVKRAKPGKYGDGGGLWLFVGSSSRSWVYRFMIAGKAREMGIGSCDDIGLAEARELARQYRAQVHRKAEHGGPLDPLAERQAAEMSQKIDRAKAVTFRYCAAEYLKANRDSWKNPKHRRQWENTLATYVFPTIGDWPVQRIDEAACVKVLSPIWHTKAETARRIRMRIETVIEWAIAARAFRGDNPARRAVLKHLLGAQTDIVKHHKALPYAEMNAFTVRLQAFEGIGALPLEWAILTVTRTSEALGTTWEEVGDLQRKVWTLPGPRRKKVAKVMPDLEIPLSDRCIEILDEAAARTGRVGLVFPNHEGEQLGENTLLNTIKDQLGVAVTTHGFRSTFKDWAEDCTSFPTDIIEMAMGHKIRNKVEAAYRRGTALEKRRRLMEAWARFCATPSVEKGTVVRIGTA